MADGEALEACSHEEYPEWMKLVLKAVEAEGRRKGTGERMLRVERPELCNQTECVFKHVGISTKIPKLPCK